MPFKRNYPKIGRNSECPCGSKQKFKHCCLARSQGCASRGEPNDPVIKEMIAQTEAAKMVSGVK